jgi:tetratricopeptide (TPR) repeat protein
VGDRAGEGGTYGNLGNVYQSQGDYAMAIEYHGQHLAIAKEVDARAGEGVAYANLGNAYDSKGDYAKAIEYHGQHLAIAKEVDAREGEGVAYANLENAYHSAAHLLGDFSKAIEHHGQQRPGGGGLGVREPRECVSFAGELFEGHRTPRAAPGICIGGGRPGGEGRGVREPRHWPRVLGRVRQSRRLFRSTTCYGNIAARQGPDEPVAATGADHVRGPHRHSSASSCLNDKVREAAKWLQGVYNWDVTVAAGVGKRGARTRPCSRAAAAV